VGHFKNVIFERNYATDQGGALHSSGAGANLIIEDCIFRLNTSSLGKDVVNLSGAQVEFRGANGIH
jgi:predicted outer membrane repeat protein